MNDKNEFDDFDDDEGFEDFDSGGSSLGDLWRNNPLLKFGVVAVGVLVVLGGVFALSGGDGRTENNISRVAQAPDARETPGAENLTEAYKDQLRKENQERAEAALRSNNKSQVPTPIFDSSNDVLDQIAEEEADEEDPFAVWRMEELKREVKQEKETLEQDQDAFVEAFEKAVQTQPDPETVAQLSNAMLAQMQQILGAQSISPSNIITVTSQEFLNPPASDNGVTSADPFDVTNDVQQITEEDILIPVGSVLYGQLMTEANTDAPGPILGQILDGDFVGARIIGDFDNTERYITLNFSRMTIGKKSYAIQAVALDPNTSLTGLQTEYNPRYFRRAILPAAARFLEGLGSAIAESESTTVSIDGTTVVTEEEDVDVEQELARGLEVGAREVGDILDEQGDDIQPLIRVTAGTPIVLFFTDDVLKDAPRPVTQTMDKPVSNGIGATDAELERIIRSIR